MVEGARHREQGRKDYDWSHLAMRYWPGRVDGKCRQDPSLGVAHGCFWRYHPERAWTWELRLQDEIGPDFRIEEPPYRPGGRDLGDAGDVPHRDAFLRDHPKAATRRHRDERPRGGWAGARSVRSSPRCASWRPASGRRHAEALWDLELRLAERQGAEIRILAPDEPAARAAFEAAHPEKVADRKDFLASLVPPVELFDDERRRDEDDETRRTTRDDGCRPWRRRRGLGGPVSAALEADLRSWVRRHGIVVWLDQAGTLQRVRRAAPGAAGCRWPALRGPRLPGQPPGADAWTLDGVAAGTEKAPLVIHLPGFTEETVRQTPLFELYAAGVRYRKALDTLVTEAASGQVRPDQIDSFRAQPGMTLDWCRRLAQRAPRRRRGRRHRGTAAGHEPGGRPR